MSTPFLESKTPSNLALIILAVLLISQAKIGLNFQAMDGLEQEIFALFESLEKNLQETVVMDGTSIEYFDDSATDYFVNTKFEIVDLISAALPRIIEAKSDLAVLPAIALCADVYALAKILSQNKERFPLAFEYAESRTLDDFNWQPIYDALRNYFDEDVIALISSKYEFDLARTAYMEILEIAENFYSYGEFEDFRFNVNALKECSLAEDEDLEALDRLLEILEPPEPYMHTYQPTVKVYSGSTGGLEPRFIEWLEKHHKSQTLFEEEDLDFSAPLPEEDGDWDNVLRAWLETDSQPQSAFENYYWIPIDVRAPIDYEFEEKAIFFEIHQLSQIIRDPNNSHLSHLPESLQHYKIIMYRTGERHEYNSEMDRSLLALQVILFHESSEVPVENIEAEVHWIRLEEKAYPLLGLSRDELEEISQTYLRAQ
jgi:hypothetical protein